MSFFFSAFLCVCFWPLFAFFFCFFLFWCFWPFFLLFFSVFVFVNQLLVCSKVRIGKKGLCLCSGGFMGGKGGGEDFVFFWYLVLE